MARSAKAAAADPNRVLVVTRSFAAPRSRVFRAFTDRNEMKRWFGPEGFTISACAIDLRVGGAYRVVMRSPQGTEHIVRGVYQEISKPERLAFTWAWEDDDGELGAETVVTVSFAENDGKTQLRLSHRRFESKKARDAHKGGWISTLVCLAEHLSSRKRA
jgi:uncharacterized protein YndB with AHSA1/START domain